MNLQLCDELLDELSKRTFPIKYEKRENLKEIEQCVNKMIIDGYVEVHQHGFKFYDTHYEITKDGRGFNRDGGYAGMMLREKQHKAKQWRDLITIGIAILGLIISIVALLK